MKKMAAGIAMAAVIVTGSAADDVLDTIDDAVAAYKSGNYSQAVEDLNYASELIRQKKGENLKDYLPAPLAGWKASEAESQTASTAMMGGGTVVQRRYTKGDSSVEVQIITDSPMMQTVAMMIGNPMFMGGGGKMTRINRQKAIIEYDKQQHSGQIQMVAGEKYLIIVSGDNVSEDDLQAYAKAIDVKKLNSLK
jgi:hypothetical protein